MNTLPTVYIEYVDGGNKVVVDNLDTALALIDACPAAYENPEMDWRKWSRKYNPEKDWKVQS